MSNKLLKKRYNGHCLYRVIPDPRYLTLLTNGYGTLLADALSGYNRDVVHLTATPNEDCHFIDYDSTACEIVGDDLTFGNSDCTAQANFDRNVHNVTTLTSNYGSISVNKNTGYSGDTFTLSNTPNTDCSFGSYSVTGATLTSNQFMMQKQDVSAQGSFSRNVHNVTLQNDGHGSIVANKTTGYSGDTITLSNTANAAYDFSGYTVTGATLTSNQFNIGTENVTAKAWFKKHAYSLTLQNDGHGTIAASKTTGYSGDSITLSNTPATNYQFSGYSVTGATLNGSTVKLGASNATAKAWFKELPVSSVYYTSTTTTYTTGSTLNKTVSINKAVTACRYLTIKVKSYLATYGNYAWIYDMNFNFNNGSWNRRNRNLYNNCVPLKYGGSFTAQSYSTRPYVITRNIEGTSAWLENGGAPDSEKWFKLVIDRTNNVGSAYYNGTYFGKGSTPSNITSFNSYYIAKSGSTAYCDVFVDAIYAAGFRDFNAATAY